MIALRSLVLTTFLSALTAGLLGALDKDHIPAFARKYGVSCNLCHQPFPRLTAFGETFAGNGFRMTATEPGRDTIATGDPLLTLMRDLPLAFRLDAYVSAFNNGDVVTDFKTPYNLKILSGGPISDDISYYLYFFLFERGEVGGVEDAFIYFNDIGGSALDVAVGQFQISDPMFKRELRLEFQDYAVYRARVGDQPADLTYDRGVMVIADVAGFTVTGEAVNGNGRGPAEADRQLDNDAIKSVFGHLTRDVSDNVRLGAMGYYGRQEGSQDGGATVKNRVWMVGADATVSYGPVELNAQYILREDNRPTFTPGEQRVRTKGGFAEVLFQPAASRWYGLALYNRVDADRDLLNVRLGGPIDVGRHETLTGGVGYILRRNLRVLGEVTWDMEQDEGRWTVGLSTAF